VSGTAVGLGSDVGVEVGRTAAGAQALRIKTSSNGRIVFMDMDCNMPDFSSRLYSVWVN
jgi:hypothetical protein